MSPPIALLLERCDMSHINFGHIPIERNQFCNMIEDPGDFFKLNIAGYTLGMICWLASECFRVNIAGYSLGMICGLVSEWVCHRRSREMSLTKDAKCSCRFISWVSLTEKCRNYDPADDNFASWLGRVVYPRFIWNSSTDEKLVWYECFFSVNCVHSNFARNKRLWQMLPKSKSQTHHELRFLGTSWNLYVQA